VAGRAGDGRQGSRSRGGVLLGVLLGVGMDYGGVLEILVVGEVGRRVGLGRVAGPLAVLEDRAGGLMSETRGGGDGLGGGSDGRS
jgi:hypothetical protein